MPGPLPRCVSRLVLNSPPLPSLPPLASPPSPLSYSCPCTDHHPEQEPVLHFPPLARLDLDVDDRSQRGHAPRRADAQTGDGVPDAAAVLQAADAVVRARRLGGRHRERCIPRLADGQNAGAERDDPPAPAARAHHGVCSACRTRGPDLLWVSVPVL